MNDRKGASKNWEHSRYKDWRPSYRDDSGGGRRRDTYDPHRDQRVYRPTLIGRLLRFCVWIAIFVAIIGPGFDFVNGMAKSETTASACTLHVVVDGGRVLATCPNDGIKVHEIAGFVAPNPIEFGCTGEFLAGLHGSLDLRAALFSADRISLRPATAAPVVPPVGGGDDAAAVDGGADAEAAAEEGPAAEADAEPEATPAPTPTPAAGGPLRLLVDGVDVSGAMIAAGRAKSEAAIADGEGWCG